MIGDKVDSMNVQVNQDAFKSYFLTEDGQTIDFVNPAKFDKKSVKIPI